MKRLSQVGVSDLRVAADIGVHSHEIGRRQTLVISVIADIVTPREDALAETIDYNRIVEYAQDLARERICLIETYAARLADLCLQSDLVVRVEVSVQKPAALLNGLASTRIVRWA
ncbi:dihydroneopterin aldolase (plasmid) [Novosphingobium pentaromativorans US6-1]|nr:dihydroneopterin aldolase [Novosphingobium pentaromativorans US6-1]